MGRPRGAGRAALSWGLAELNGQPCAHRGGRWGLAPALPASPAVPVLRGLGELRLLQEALLPPSLASPLTPAPALAPAWLWGLVSGGGPCLSSWERRPRGLVVELLCVQNGAGVRGIRHQDGALCESGWGRLRG